MCAPIMCVCGGGACVDAHACVGVCVCVGVHVCVHVCMCNMSVIYSAPSTAVVFHLQMPHHQLPAICLAPATVTTMAKSHTSVLLAQKLIVAAMTLLQ